MLSWKFAKCPVFNSRIAPPVNYLMQRQVENELLSEGSIEIEQDAEGNVRFFVEKVLDSRYNKSSQCQEYKLKWKGYPIEQSTWELDTNIDAPSVRKMTAEFDRQLATTEESKVIAEERKRNYWHQVRYLVPQFHYDSSNKNTLLAEPKREKHVPRTASSSFRGLRKTSTSPIRRKPGLDFPVNRRNVSNQREKKILGLIKSNLRRSDSRDDSKPQDSSIRIATKTASNAKPKHATSPTARGESKRNNSLRDSSVENVPQKPFAKSRGPARKTVPKPQQIDADFEKKEEEIEQVKLEKSLVQARKRATESPILVNKVSPDPRKKGVKSPTTKIESESPPRRDSSRPNQTAAIGRDAPAVLEKLKRRKSSQEVQPKRTSSLKPLAPSPIRRSKIFEEELDQPLEDSESSVFLSKLKKPSEKRRDRSDRVESQHGGRQSKKSSRSRSKKSKRSQSRASRQSSRSKSLRTNMKHKLSLKKGEFFGMMVRDDPRRILSHYNEGEDMHFLIEWKRDHKGRKPVSTYVTEGELVETFPDLLVEYLSHSGEAKAKRPRSTSKRSKSSRSHSRHRSKSRKSSRRRRSSSKGSHKRRRSRRDSRRAASSHRSRSSRRSRSSGRPASRAVEWRQRKQGGGLAGKSERKRSRSRSQSKQREERRRSRRESERSGRRGERSRGREERERRQSGSRGRGETETRRSRSDSRRSRHRGRSGSKPAHHRTPSNSKRR